MSRTNAGHHQRPWVLQDQLSEQVKEVERENKRAYARALRDGWSEEDLKKLGLDEAGDVRRRTRRGQARRKLLDPSGVHPVGNPWHDYS